MQWITPPPEKPKRSLSQVTKIVAGVLAFLLLALLVRAWYVRRPKAAPTPTMPTVTATIQPTALPPLPTPSPVLPRSSAVPVPGLTPAIPTPQMQNPAVPPVVNGPMPVTGPAENALVIALVVIVASIVILYWRSYQLLRNAWKHIFVLN